MQYNDVNYAAKLVKFEIENPQTFIEIDLTMRINHPNIVKGFDFFRIKTYLIIVEELADSILTNVLENLDLKTKIKYIYQLGLGLHFLYSKGIIHCDLKPDNIFIINDRIVIGDMGVAQYMNITDQPCQSLYFTAPEILYKLKKMSFKYYKVS